MAKLIASLLLLLPLTVYGEAFEWDYDMSLIDDGFVEGFNVHCNDEIVWTGATRQTGNITLGKGRNTCFVEAYKGDETSGPSDTLRFLSGPLPSPETLRFYSP